MEFLVENQPVRQSTTIRKRLQCSDLLVKLIMAKGWKHDVIKNYSQIEAANYWQFNGLIPTKIELGAIKSAHLLWYIRNNVPFQDPIWNGSFLNGLCRGGSIKNPRRVSKLSFEWWNNKSIFNLLKENPFAEQPVYNPFKGRYNWSSISLGLEFDKKSMSYLAGVMACARPYIHPGPEKKLWGTFASFPPKMMEDLKALKIPIEKHNKKRILISPVFPALLQPYMPPVARIWGKVKNPYRGMVYSAVLWKTYGLFEFTKNAIPYLVSRRNIFYKFKTDELTKDTNITNIKKGTNGTNGTGAMNRLDKLWVEYNLTELDSRFRMAIQSVPVPNKEEKI